RALLSFPTRRSSDLACSTCAAASVTSGPTPSPGSVTIVARIVFARFFLMFSPVETILHYADRLSNPPSFQSSPYSFLQSQGRNKIRTDSPSLILGEGAGGWGDTSGTCTQQALSQREAVFDAVGQRQPACLDDV